MKIGDIRDPNMFQTLVQRLYVADRGDAFQIVDDSGGDAGNDGYDAKRQMLFSMYCPEKPASADYLRKGKADLTKVIELSKRPSYRIREWCFVTPTALREPVQSELRMFASAHGMTATFVSDTYLEDIYLQHPHLHDAFPALEYPKVAAVLQELLQRLTPHMESAPQPIKPSEVNPVRGALTILDRFPSGRLLEFATRLDSGDESALAEIERFRAESLDQGDVLSSLLLELDFEQRRRNHRRALALATIGMEKSKGTEYQGELAIFGANLAFEKAFELCAADIDLSAQMAMERSIGIMTIDEASFRAREQSIKLLARAIDSLIVESQNAAIRSNNILAFFIVAVRRGGTITRRFFPFAFALKNGTSPTARSTIDSLETEMEGVYEAAIRAASAIGDDRRLALAYLNYANDLVAFGEVLRGKQHAIHALQLASGAGDSELVEKSSMLLRMIDDNPDGASAFGALSD